MSETTTVGPVEDGDTAGLVPIMVEIPSGSLEFGPDDVIVAERTGDLVVYRDLLAGVSDRRELLADYPDPTGPVTEGPGPNAVDDVAGVVDGTLVFADCCEPISGNVLVATGAPDGVRPVAAGYGPTLGPDGTQLASANNQAIQRSSTTDGSGVARFLNQGPLPDGFLDVDDVAWVDDEGLALLGWDDEGYALFAVDVGTLTIGEGARFDVGDDDLPLVRFAGRAPTGELAVMVAGAASTDLRYFRADDLTEDESMAESLTAGATAAQRGYDGVGLLWVDGDTLYWAADQVPGDGAPGPTAAAALLDEVSAGWFPAPR